MTIALMLVTHVNVGKDMLSAAESIVGETAENTACIDVPMDTDTDTVRSLALAALDGLDYKDGVLILSDTFGSTPCNIASRLLESCRCNLVSGLNLPMLLSILNYRDLPLDEVTDKAVNSGCKGITAQRH